MSSANGKGPGHTLADLTDAHLEVVAASVGGTVEHVDPKPRFGTPEWHQWADRHFPARPDEWWLEHARRTRERAASRKATWREWAALAEYRRYMRTRGETDADRLRRAGGMDFSGWQPYRGGPR